jgi:hypothetical protein
LNDTLTLATGSGAGVETERAAVPLLPDDVAVIVTLPGLTAVATPFAVIVAMVGLELLQVTAALATGVPPAIVTVALSCCVAPTCSCATAGETLTEVMPLGITLTVDVADRSPDCAVMLAVPTPMAVTTPALLTVATLAFAELQVTAPPVIKFPA